MREFICLAESILSIIYKNNKEISASKDICCEASIDHVELKNKSLHFVMPLDEISKFISSVSHVLLIRILNHWNSFMQFKKTISGLAIIRV